MQHSLTFLDVGFSSPYIAPERNSKTTQPCLSLIASSGSYRLSSGSTAPSSDQRVLHRPSEPAALTRYYSNLCPKSGLPTLQEADSICTLDLQIVPTVSFKSGTKESKCLAPCAGFARGTREEQDANSMSRRKPRLFGKSIR